MKTEILYGIHPVREALNAGRRKFYEIYVCREKTNKRVDNLIELAKSADIPVRHIHRQKLQSIAGTDTHQGAAAKVSPYPLLSLSEIISDQAGGDNFSFYLLIDNIVDPHNLGALLRTALCVGITGVVTPKDRCAEPSPTVSKSSAGALEHINLARVVNMATAIKNLKKNNVWIIGLDKNGDRSIYENDFNENIALVVGGEKSGIRPLIKKHCDFLSFIPQTGQVSSLNASVAGGIAMYEAYRQRQRKDN